MGMVELPSQLPIDKRLKPKHESQKGRHFIQN